MRLHWLALLLIAAASARAGGEAVPDKKQTVKFVQFFINTPIPQLPPGRVDDFMAVDPAALPAKLRRPYAARRLELQALKQLADGKKKGTLRTPEKDCAIPTEAKSDAPGILKLAGFEEIQEDEERDLLDKTQCTERDMMCEWSLQITVERDKKGRVLRRRFFLYPSDPLMVFVGLYRKHSQTGGSTNFFGSGGPLCSH